MYNGGDAAEQIFRMSLNGIETAVKITGACAKQLAILLYTILSDQKKTRGRARLGTMLKSGEPQKIFSIRESDLKTFVKEAKRYGILYHTLRKSRGAPDDLADIMVPARDAHKVSRIIERFHFADVQTADVQAEILRERAEKETDALSESVQGPDGNTTQTEPERTPPQKNDTDKLLDDLLGKPAQKEQNHMENPTKTSAEKSPPSEVFSEHSRTTKTENSRVKVSKRSQDKKKPSVIGTLRSIDVEQRQQEKAQPPQLTVKSKKSSEKGR